jgi:hypothetical protein
MAVTLDFNPASDNTASGATSVDFTSTVGSGANREQIAFLYLNTGGGSPGTVLINWDSAGTNQSMTNLGNVAIGTAAFVYLFGLRSPTVGANLNLHASWTNPADAILTCVSYFGGEQSSDANAFKNLTTNTGTSTTASVTVTTTTSDAVAAGFFASANSFGGQSNTLIVNEVLSSNGFVAQFEVGNASATLTASISSSVAWGAIGVRVVAASASSSPPGKQSYDSAPRAADPFAQWRTWFETLNPNLVGRDALPPGQRLYELPPRIADPFAQWRAWTGYYNPNLIGLDALSPGQRLFSLPPLGPQRGIDFLPPNLLLTTLVPGPPLPPGQKFYDLPPRSGELFAQWRSWSSFNNSLIGQDRFPSGTQLFTLPPLGPQRGVDFAAPNLLSTLLALRPLPPGTQFYELSPRSPDPFARWRSWTASYNLNLVGKDALPAGAQSYELPPRVGDAFAQWRTCVGGNPLISGPSTLFAGVGGLTVSASIIQHICVIPGPGNAMLPSEFGPGNATLPSESGPGRATLPSEPGSGPKVC